MKKLKIGDLVYHKKYGIGIVSKVGIGCLVFFESIGATGIGNRENLFTKGDKVLIRKTDKSYGQKQFSRNDVRDFIGYAPHCKKHKYVVSHLADGGHCTIHSYTYVFDVEHAQECYKYPHEHEQDAWDLFREESKAYDEFVNRCKEFEKERIDNNKQQMLKDIQIMKLEATAKEMLEAIKEIRNE